MAQNSQEPETVATGYESGILFALTLDADGGGIFDAWVAGEWRGNLTGPLPGCVDVVRGWCRERSLSNVWLALHEDPTHGNKA